MPYPNYHAARMRDPGRFDRFAASKDKLGPGIMVIYGVKDGRAMIQAIRFHRDKWSESEAKKWLRDHKYNPILFEPASGRGAVAKVRVTKAQWEEIEGELLSAIEMRVAVFKQDEEKRIAYGVVLEPDTLDTQKDIATAEEIERAAHYFMVEGNRQMNLVHMQDTWMLTVVESYIAPVDFKIGDEQVKKGSWVMAVRSETQEVWDAMKTGLLTGFSIGAETIRRKVVVQGEPQ